MCLEFEVPSGQWPLFSILRGHEATYKGGGMAEGHQFHFPSRLMMAGTSTVRMTNVSISTAQKQGGGGEANVSERKGKGWPQAKVWRIMTVVSPLSATHFNMDARPRQGPAAAARGGNVACAKNTSLAEGGARVA